MRRLGRWLGRGLAGLLLTAVLLGVVEGSLRLFSLAPAPDHITAIGVRQAVRDLTTLRADGHRSYALGWGDAVTADFDGREIVVLGGSAAMGDGCVPVAAFSARLRTLLTAVLPVPVQVVNLGAGGVDSTHVLLALEALLADHHPDLIVVYSGNNEFHELRLHKAANPGFDSRLELTRRRLNQVHLYRVLRQAVVPAVDEAALDRTELPSLGELAVPVTDDDRALVAKIYEENLARMVALARDAGVPILLTTVADNLLDRAGARTVADDEAEWIAGLLADPVRRDPTALSRAAVAAAPYLHTQAAHAEVGVRLLEAGRVDQAVWWLERAETLAQRPLRSNAAMRDGVRRLAAEEQVPLCDVSRALAALSPRGVAGDDVFRDGCHPNALGHHRIAGILARCLVDEGLVAPSDPAAARTLLEQALAGAPAQDDPFRAEHFACRSTRRDQQGRPDDGTALAAARLGHEAWSFQQLTRAKGHYHDAMARGGPPGGLTLNLAMLALYRHDVAGARAHLAAAEELMPGDPLVAELSGLLAP